MVATPSTQKTGLTDLGKSKALLCARGALDKRAESVKILDLTELSGFTNFFVIASGSSTKQVQSIADFIELELKAQGERCLSIEGYAEGRWVLMDFGSVVVHLFLDALREYYDLENLWASAQTIPIPQEFYMSLNESSRLN